MNCMNAKCKIQNVKLLIVLFLIFNFTFYIQSVRAADPQQVVIEINQFCFRKDECKTYGATEGPYPDPLCSSVFPGPNKAAVDNFYIYNCYANQKPTKLQVSIGGYEVPSIEEYVKRLYTYLISIAGIVAGIMIVWAGTKWLTSAGSPEKITDAKKKIGNAVLGLILVLGSYVILQTVNPALVELHIPAVKIIRKELGETQEWCVKRTEFPCGGDAQHANGQWQCSDPTHLDNPPCAGGPGGNGNCYGQYCAGAGNPGCSRFDSNKILLHSDAGDLDVAGTFQMIQQKFHSAVCVTESECGNCAGLVDASALYTPDTIPDGVAKCLSNSCKCVLGGSQSGSNWHFACYNKADPGQPCAADAQCKSGICNFGGANTCAQEGGDKDETSCHRGIECASGLCNTGRSGGVCVRAKSIPDTYPCSDSGQCQSGFCSPGLLNKYCRSL